MTDLDKKLEEHCVMIFKIGMLDAYGSKNKPDPIPALKEIQSNIKQAFIDDGWVTPDNAAKVQSLVNNMTNLAHYMNRLPVKVYVALDNKQQTVQELMTGQEWYDKFIAELNQLGWSTKRDDAEVFDAAKKASGIE